MARPAQASGDGWVADRLVGGLGKTPTPGQKRLRGKIVKTRHSRQYKKGHSRAQGGGRTTEQESERQSKKHRKEKKELERKEKQKVSKSVIVGMHQ